ncbi:hypothetical protein L9F63_004691 [Diploptera punctata]|uniref:DNA replication complex GINS protein PSF3 n=1 Tax=Diploptera punctata TaxID=6984 RepID=A0AAD8E7L0_DIPPU|nr:hypothetical protein L9F63_004691 [Diploptera punctata]
MKYLRPLTPNYFSIDDIFATQERLPCKFLVPVHRLGFLDPSSENEDLAEGTSLELPLWLHRVHLQHSGDIWEILKADASVVDLHKLSIYFYDFGIYLSKMGHRESAAIAVTLPQTFKERFRQVMDWAHNSGTDPTVAQGLDNLERILFQEGHATRVQLDAWLNDGSRKITAADMVINHKKRKRAALDDL